MAIRTFFLPVVGATAADDSASLGELFNSPFCASGAQYFDFHIFHLKFLFTY